MKNLHCLRAVIRYIHVHLFEKDVRCIPFHHRTVNEPVRASRICKTQSKVAASWETIER